LGVQMLARPLPKLVLSGEEEIALKGLESPRTTAQAVASRALGAPAGSLAHEVWIAPYLGGRRLGMGYCPQRGSNGA
jgi:hypothetical protein